MTFGLSAAAIGGIAAAVGGIGSAFISSNASANASNAQQQASANAIAQQQAQFNSIKELLAPYVNSGTTANTMASNIAGANGPSAQSQAVANIQNGGVYQGLKTQGENTILQNASATGGLRGGNVQGALAQFSPQLLNSLIQQQFGQLNTLSSTGENAAAMTGNLGQNMSNSVSSLMQAGGAAQAGGIMSQANAVNGGINSLIGGLGTFLGGGF